MSQLLVKYQQNQTAADRLINEHKLYAASVHCSYYSCIQLITYLFLAHVPGINKEDFEADLAAKDSHKYLISKMGSELRGMEVTSREINEFDSILKELKILRNKADYKDIEINEWSSKLAQTKSIKVITILKSKFSLS